MKPDQEIVFRAYPYQIIRQDAGMGETDYFILKHDEFFAMCDNQNDAETIVRAVLTETFVKGVK